MSNVDIQNDSSITDNKWKPEATKDFKFAIDKKSIVPTKDDSGVAIGTFFGIASVYSVVDLQNDIVEKGAFTRTLSHKEHVIPLLWQHEQTSPIGIVKVEDSDQGLIARGEINLEVEKGREAYALLKQGALKGLSIGYDVIKDGYKNKVRLLRELKLYEISLVTFAANPLAMVTSVKSVSPFLEDVLIADPAAAWDSANAKKRVKEFATKDGKFDPKTYAKAFLWYDENASDDEDGYPDVVGAYKLPICDIIDGKIQIVPKALYAAAAVMQGSRGGVDIPEKEANAVKSTISKYYDKLNKTTPWDAETKTAFEVGLYSVIAMTQPLSKKSLSDEERHLVQIAIDALKQLIEISETVVKLEKVEAEPAGKPAGDMPYVTYDLSGDYDIGALMAILDKILGGKALDDKEREFMGKIKIDLKDAASKVESKAAEIKPAEVPVVAPTAVETKAAETTVVETKAAEVVEVPPVVEIKNDAQSGEGKSLAHIWKEQFIPALKAYGKDVEAGGEMSPETKQMFLEIGQKLQAVEEDMTKTENIWNDFVETLSAYGEDVFTKGEPRKEISDKLAFLQERIFVKETKAAAPAPMKDVECPKCGASLNVELPAKGVSEYSCPDCKTDFDVDPAGKAVIAPAAPEEKPAAPEKAEEEKAKTKMVNCTCPECDEEFPAEIDGSTDTYTVTCPECDEEFDVDATGKIAVAEEEPQAPEETKKEEAAIPEPKIEAVPEVKAADAPVTETKVELVEEVKAEEPKAQEVPVAVPEVIPENITVTPAVSPLETKGLDNNEIGDSEDNSLVEILEDFRTMRADMKKLNK